MARPTAQDLTPELIEAVADAYRTGLTMKLVAGLVGIHERTLGRWLQAGNDEITRQHETPTEPPRNDPRLSAFVELALAVKEADSKFVQEQLLIIRRAAVEGKQVKTVTRMNSKTGVTTTERTETVGGLWTAAAWLTERRHTQDYGRQTKMEISGPDGGPIQVDDSAEARISEKLEAYYQGVADGREIASEAAPSAVDGTE